MLPKNTTFTPGDVITSASSSELVGIAHVPASGPHPAMLTERAGIGMTASRLAGPGLKEREARTKTSAMLLEAEKGGEVFPGTLLQGKTLGSDFKGKLSHPP